MKCPSCRSGSGSLIDMAPGEKRGQFVCPVNSLHRAQLNDLGFRPALFTPLPGPVLTPTNTTVCRWEPCSLPFVASRGAQYCSEPCRFQARQAARKTYVTPGIQQRSERTSRILAKVNAALASAGVAADQGWHAGGGA